jgi:Zn-dependent protease/predicted transcriptional regulator
MGWSWRIGRLFGIDLYVHVTFPLLLAWFVIGHYVRTQDWRDAVGELFFILVVFGIIILHELGHALAARRYGIATRDITLLPIGGVARLERMPEDPWQELVVAVAGPAVNVVLAVVLGAALLLTGELREMQEATPHEGTLLSKLVWVNVILVVFNMIPAFPMDGGRVLRAFLAMQMDYLRATQIAASIGQGMALLFGFAGLLYGMPLLVFVALFVWLAASGEASMVQMKAALGGIPVQKAMVRQFQTLAPHDTLAAAAQHVLNGFQQDFPVLHDGRVVGILTRSDLITALSQHGPGTTVEGVMQRNFETASPKEMLETALARLQACDCRTLPVLENGRLVGLVTSDVVGEFVMIQAALRGNAKAPAA